MKEHGVDLIPDGEPIRVYTSNRRFDRQADGSYMEYAYRGREPIKNGIRYPDYHHLCDFHPKHKKIN